VVKWRGGPRDSITRENDTQNSRAEAPEPGRQKKRSGGRSRNTTEMTLGEGVEGKKGSLGVVNTRQGDLGCLRLRVHVKNSS